MDEWVGGEASRMSWRGTTGAYIVCIMLWALEKNTCTLSALHVYQVVHVGYMKCILFRSWVTCEPNTRQW